MEALISETWPGTFNLGGKEITGEITLDRGKTTLCLGDKDCFGLRLGHDNFILGKLHDLRKVCLIDCVGPPIPGSTTRRTEHYYFANLFPHFVVFGEHDFNPADPAIVAIDFLIDDASTLFYHFF